jgi:hypothetical protein
MKCRWVGRDEVRISEVQYWLEVFVGEEAPLDVESEEAVGGEGDGLLPAEAVPEDTAVFQPDSCPDVGRQLTGERRNQWLSASLSVSCWFDNAGGTGRGEMQVGTSGKKCLARRARWLGFPVLVSISA